jgi:hypothetical protein
MIKQIIDKRNICFRGFSLKCAHIFDLLSFIVDRDLSIPIDPITAIMGKIGKIYLSALITHVETTTKNNRG